MRGQPERAFNLLTAPHVSLNAEFIKVPKNFRAEDITDTVLGSVHVAACAPDRVSLAVTFNVSTGNLTVEALDKRGQPIEVSATASRGGRPAKAVAATYGVRLLMERYVCDLRRMACNWEETSSERAEPLRLPRYDSGFSRIKLRTEKVSPRPAACGH